MLIELEMEEKEEFQKDVICLNPIQLTLAFQHPLHSLDGRAVPTRPLLLVATGGQQIVLVIKQELTYGRWTQVQNWRQDCEKCHLPCKSGTNIGWNNKIASVLQVCSLRPTLACE